MSFEIFNEYKSLKIILEEAENLAHAGSWELDASMKHAFWSAEIRHIAGIGPNDVAGPDFLRTIIHKDDWDRVETSLLSTLQQGTPHHMQYRIYRQNDSEMRWVECTARRSIDPDTADFRLIGVVQDITQKVNDTQELQHAYAEIKHYQEIADATEDLIAYICQDFRYIAVNRAYAQFHNRQREQIIGKSVIDVVGEKNFTLIQPLLLKALKGEKFSVKNHFQLPGSKKIIYEEGTFWPYLDEQDKIRGVAVSIRDITKEEESTKNLYLAQQALKKNEQFLNTIIEHIPHILFVKDAKTLKYVRINKTFETIFGISAEEIIGKTDHQFFPSKVADFNVEKDKESILNGKTVDIPEETLNSKTQGLRTFHTKKIPISDETGEVHFLMGLAEDITDKKELESELREQRDLFRIVNDENPDIILMKDYDGKYLFSNAALAKLYNTTPEAMLGKYDSEFNPNKEQVDFYQRNIREIMDKFETTIVYETSTDVNTGEIRHYRSIKKPLKDAQGNLRVLVIAHDITDIRNSEQKLRQFATVTENTAEGVMITDADKRIIAVNKAFTTITGYSETEVLGKNPAILHSALHDNSFFDTMWQSINDEGVWRGEIWNRSKDGHNYPEWLTINRVTDDHGEILNYVGVFSDTTKLKESESKLAHMALHDPLTSLGNRLMLSSQMEHAIKAAQRGNSHLALLFLDLDNFKNINDTYGHDVGDAILTKAAKRLSKSLRNEDTLVRFGGDEFVIILEHLKRSADVTILADKLLKHFVEPFSINKQAHFLSASIGIAVFPEDGESYEALLKAADTAMYRAKAEGKNRFAFYDRSLTDALMEQMAIENSLREAIASEQFELYYQPQLSFQDRCVTGFEALVRWNHPRMGLMAPNRFIPIAEKNHLIMPLGEWILTEACKQANLWHKKGIFDGRMGVNVSGTQMEHGDLPGIISKALAISELNPDQLEIEVTESVVMKNPQRWIAMFANIRAIGVHISIDDFGTGYSSLSYLQQFPLDKLKIDKSFVDDLPHNEDACAIANTIIALAKNMGLSTLAEGVETSEQASYLIDKGCDSVQGYLFDRPLKADDAEQRLLHRGGYELP